MLKCGATLCAESLRESLRDWIINEPELLELTNNLNKLELSNEMSETAIERKIVASSELIELLKTIKSATEGNTIVQHHSGSGDNVGGNKIIHYGK